MDSSRHARLSMFMQTQINYVRVHDLVDYFYNIRFISRTQKQRFDDYLMVDAAKQLLNLITESVDYDKLVQGLEKTGQEYLAHFLQHKIAPDAPLSKVDQNNINDIFTFIVANLKLDPILQQLKSIDNYFTQSEIMRLERENDKRLQNDYFVTNVLMQGSYRHLTSLCDILNRSGQKELAEKLSFKQDPILLACIDSSTTEETSNGKFSRNPPPKPASMVQREVNQGPGTLPIIKSITHQMILSKEYTMYDLWSHLRKFKDRVYVTPQQLNFENGFNILHKSVELSRLALFNVVIYMGWWKILAIQKVPENNEGEYRGKTPKEIAEAKKAKKPLDEIDQFNKWEESLTPIMKAVRHGDVAKFKKELESQDTIREHIHYRDFNNGNVLYWAVVSGNLEILKKLLEAGVDATMRTKKQETLMHIACSLGHSHLINTLIESGVETNVEDQSHKTPYDKIAENGDIDAAIIMMKNGLYPSDRFPVITSFYGRNNCLKYSLQCLMMNINSKDMYERTPLHRAIEGSKFEIVKYLLEIGASLNEITITKRNVLHIVSESGNIQIYDLLENELKKRGYLFDRLLNQPDRYNGVELCFLIRGRDRGRDAWHYVEVERAKVPLFMKKTKLGNVDVTSFGVVVKSGWGINPDQENIEEIEQMFKTRRLDTSLPMDMTPLHIALFKGHTEVALKLIKEGADVNAKDSFGLTPLMLASSKGLINVVKELEKSGANFKVKSKKGQTAMLLAEENEQDEVIAFFKGRNYFQMCSNFLQGDVATLKQSLSSGKLDEIRAGGNDVQTHLVNTLRDFRIDINQLLVDLGSGPVLEASSES